MDYTKFDDESLIRLILLRQENALGVLYDRYGRLVYSIALNILSEATAAEEVTQDVFMRVLGARRNLPGRAGQAGHLAGADCPQSLD